MRTRSDALAGLLVICAAPACLANDPSEILPGRTAQAIAGGMPVAEDAWPNVVLLDGGCTGTLIAPDLVVYAGHCGTDITQVHFGERFDIVLGESSSDPVTIRETGARGVVARECRAHPNAAIGSGADLAYCVLEQALTEVPIAPPAVGCEREQVRAGTPVTLVGFGYDQPDGVAGVKRTVDTAVDQEGRELVIGDATAGTCRGDSGSPAFVSVTTGLALPEQTWRLLGVMSSGEEETCGAGYYTEIARHMPWLEEESQRDLTPCTDAWGVWMPTADCTAPSLGPAGEPLDEAVRWLASCGPSGKPAERDESPPSIRFTEETTSAGGDGGAGALLIELDANDGHGWGVRRVELSLFDRSDRLLGRYADELPPYAFYGPAPRSELGRLAATAVDRADLSSSAEHRLAEREQTQGDCSATSAGRSAHIGLRLELIVLLLAIGWQARRRGGR